MTAKKSYSRYFIILQEEEKGYSLASDKLPSGYAKIEIKNDRSKVSFYVQNLKKERSPYHMILICNKKEIKRLINLGELSIDDYGRTEVSYEYGIEDIAKSGIGVDKIVGAAIVKLDDSVIIPVMAGFITSESQDNWQKYTVYYNEERDNIEEDKSEERPSSVNEESKEAPVINQVQDKEILEDKSEENLEEKPPIQETLSKEDVEKDFSASSDRESNETYEPSYEEQEENNEKSVFDTYEESIQVTSESKGNYIEANMPEANMPKDSVPEETIPEENISEADAREYPVQSVEGYFHRVVEGFEKVEDFGSEIKRCKWYKIPIGSEEDWYSTDYNKYNVIYNPMYSYKGYIKRYNHFLIGFKYDKYNKIKYIVFAIPGTKSLRDQPYGGETGFVTWLPLNMGDETNSSPGYWLMFYDFRNKVIAIPIRV